ncbi:MAG: hypothetical protein ABI767_04330 [Rhodanobacter sp.]
MTPEDAKSVAAVDRMSNNDLVSSQSRSSKRDNETVVRLLSDPTGAH